MRKYGFILLILPLVWVLWPTSPPEEPSQLSLAQRVQNGTKRLRAATSALDSKNSFLELKAALRQMDTKESREWLLAQLASGEDFATQLDLTLDSAQNIAGWPSWRVFLLDLLFLTDPEAAAALSRDLLSTSASPDEWAVCLRNVARAGKDNALLKTKSAELLRRKEWQKKPSAGYLEAFDVIVHTRNTALFPELLTNCDARDEKAVRHASFLTLDRLIMAEPAKVLPELAAIASNHPQSGLMLSNMIARADVRDNAQRQAVETYLLDPKRTAEELRGFASVFPNANVAVSQNLLTQPMTIQGADLNVRDRVSMEVVSAWLMNEQFKPAHEALRAIVLRMKGWRSSNYR
ncbi:MAG: hypothetical protein IPK32_09860 [Verrucomicrobiaceae bacterium]|nr:hypothetical protein [Verrucomicrobiaceae bacterium]